jgi:hypothetical protein
VPYHRQPNIARGEIHLHDYDSKALGVTRRLRVYTPAQYQTNTKTRFPILYLLHGAGDNEAVWTEFGRAHHILDNLIAAKKAAPMIVVMTDGHAVIGNSPDARAQNVAGLRARLAGRCDAFRRRALSRSSLTETSALSPGFRWAAIKRLSSASITASCFRMSAA